jgi:hypothetical protein
MTRAEKAEATFKDFHRSLCARFGYTHDQVDCQRDQVPMDEHFIAQSAPAEARVKEPETQLVYCGFRVSPEA